MKHPKGPQKQPKGLGKVWFITAALMVFAGGLYIDYNNDRLSRPASWQIKQEDYRTAAFDEKVPPHIYLHGELEPGQFFTLYDENGEVIDYTSRMVRVEDEIILDDNRRYKVQSVDYEQNRARCSYEGKEDIRYLDAWDTSPVGIFEFDDEEGVKIGIYMTHSDESYVPTEGTESIKGAGGILKVGQRLAQELKKRGAKTEVSDNTHDPHDANAYHRSRKTAVQLLKTNPDVLFDVHRDGIEDPGFYKTELDGKELTKVRLVVGKQNPHMDANLTFAKEIKAYFDKHYPGMIKGIYLGKGNYNQDLGPRVLLIEVGTHTNSREEAEEGVAVFADGVAKYLNVSTGTQKVPGAPKEEVTRVDDSSGSTAALLALAAIGGGLIFLFISRGSGARA